MDKAFPVMLARLHGSQTPAAKWCMSVHSKELTKPFNGSADRAVSSHRDHVRPAAVACRCLAFRYLCCGLSECAWELIGHAAKSFPQHFYYMAKGGR